MLKWKPLLVLAGQVTLTCLVKFSNVHILDEEPLKEQLVCSEYKLIPSTLSMDTIANYCIVLKYRKCPLAVHGTSRTSPLPNLTCERARPKRRNRPSTNFIIIWIISLGYTF